MAGEGISIGTADDKLRLRTVYPSLYDWYYSDSGRVDLCRRRERDTKRAT